MPRLLDGIAVQTFLNRGGICLNRAMPGCELAAAIYRRLPMALKLGYSYRSVGVTRAIRHRA
jgi:hypothetical protein